MKLLIILISLQISFSINCDAQNNQYISLDSLESSFESIWKDIKMPCEWEMNARRRQNGKLIFYNKDSTGFAFDFYKVTSLPFFTTSQSDFETTQKYFSWKSKKWRDKITVHLQKVEENRKFGFIIFKIIDASGECYRILARHHDIMCSIKIFSQTLSMEEQFKQLILLHDLNKN